MHTCFQGFCSNREAILAARLIAEAEGAERSHGLSPVLTLSPLLTLPLPPSISAPSGTSVRLYDHLSLSHG